jgi:hypothetical protein
MNDINKQIEIAFIDDNERHRDEALIQFKKHFPQVLVTLFTSGEVFEHLPLERVFSFSAIISDYSWSHSRGNPVPFINDLRWAESSSGEANFIPFIIYSGYPQPSKLPEQTTFAHKHDGLDGVIAQMIALGF